MSEFGSVATVEGFLTEDALYMETRTGKHLLTFTLAIKHYVRPGTPPLVSFIHIEMWGDFALKFKNQLIKGQRCRVHGSFRQDRWEADLGNVESRLKIICNEIVLL
jgi:single-stranded DNA-binding protein